MSVSESDLVARVREDFPRLRDDLAALIGIPSVAFPGYPPEPVHEAADKVEALLRDAGVADIERLDLPDTSPAIIGRVHVDDALPTVLLYCHYDVVPADDVEAWRTPPFEATEVDGAIFGRGASDSKSNLLAHIGALRAFRGSLPVNLLVVFEGQEEAGSAFDFYPLDHPDVFACDAMVIADVGNIRPGDPTLTVALRGSAAVTVAVSTLESPKHSGQFGAAAPDALVVLIHALASLHDEHGDVAVPGLRREEWTGAGYSDDEFRALAQVLPGVPLQGTGSLGSRIWSGPAITVTGIDVPSVDKAVNAVAATARARLDVRVSPWQSAAEAQAAVVAHLEAQHPFGVSLTVVAGDIGDGVSVPTGGPIYRLAEGALADAYGTPPSTNAVGGSIPIVSALARAVPDAEVLLFGTSDGFSAIHAPNERVLIDEFERTVVAETLLLARLGHAAPGSLR
ncbi:M20/M25/M40 family metallo-hydrolase [Microbacterium sp. BWT-B31]|uniref:M20/M25/M40 family metallo-hydrolase n=1 Tax=Microbacterium sp. BWT-B31 TaxID=3232072 RepID=UPI0035284D1C